MANFTSKGSSAAVIHDRALRVAEARYRRIFETAQDGIVVLNADTGQIDDINPYLIKMLGYCYEEFLGKNIWDVGLFADRAKSQQMFAELQATGFVRYENLPFRTKAGASVSVEVVANSYDFEGVKVIQCNIRDITARTAAETQVRQHAGLYAALSQCNHTIVHCVSEEELFPEICRIAVQLGGVNMAWVGIVDSESSEVRPVSSWGDATGYLKDIKVSAKDDTPFGRGPIGQAMRGNRPVWLQDIVHNSIMIPWRERAAVSNWSTSAALPLRRGGEVVGAFCVYSDKVSFFDAPTRGLLSQLAMDISFALDGFARESHRRQVVESLRKSEEQLRALAEAVPQIVWAAGVDGGNNYFNARWADYTGLTIEEGCGDGWIKPFHPDERQQVWRTWRHAMTTIATYSLEARIRRADGIYRWWLVQGAPVRDAEGTITRWFGTCTDIHDLKTAEINIRRLNRVYSVLSGINALILRANVRDDLFDEACRIVVEAGGFRMSIMALVDPGATTFSVAASTGKDTELIALIKKALASSAAAQDTLCAQAFQEQAPVVLNHSEHDPRALYGKKCAESGIRSIVALPVIVANETVAILTVFAEEPNFFNEDEMALLKALVRDIAFAIDHIGIEERLKYLSYYDELTGLANRALFLERVGQYMRGEVNGRHKIAIMLIDLDRFKNINDSLGRPAGDALLKQVAEWLAQNRGDANLIARLGADHFGVVLPDVAQGRELARRLDDMLGAFMAHSFFLQDTVFRLSATVGVALFPNDGADAEALFRNAEAALKKAKARGHRYLFYTAAMTNAVVGRLSLETQLRLALEKEQFVLFYQPKFSLASGKLAGAEALIRWNDPQSGLVMPGSFIPSLEETGLIYEVGRWALGRAMKDHAHWRVAGFDVGRIAVNVSPIQLRDPDFIVELERTLGMDAHAAAGLELEITEGVIMEDITRSIASLRAIRAMGLTIAIDDFGTGFSSLSYLARLPVDSVKIDRSFINDMTQNPEGLVLVSTIVALARGLKLKVVAEGVETEEQSRQLRLLACDEVQGYFFGRPAPADAFESTYLVQG